MGILPPNFKQQLTQLVPAATLSIQIDYGDVNYFAYIIFS